jgi:hypothetical protein
MKINSKTFILIAIILLYCKSNDNRNNKISFLKNDIISDEFQFIVKNIRKYGPKTTWLPSRNETKEALIEVIKSLNDSTYNSNKCFYYTTDSLWVSFFKEEIPKIRNDIANYIVQYTGITINGNKLILCNFIHKRVNLINYNYKQELTIFSDGGYYFWKIEYDIKLKKCINFRSNIRT